MSGRAATSARRRADRSAPAAEPRRRNLRVVNPVAGRGRALRRRLFALSMLSLAVGMFGVATAHATLVERQRELDAMRDRIAELEDAQGRVEREIIVASAPEAILERAFALGMVRAVDPVYLVAIGDPSAGSETDPASDPASDPATDPAADPVDRIVSGSDLSEDAG